MAIKIRKSRNLKSNPMSKQTSAKFFVANEGLLYIKNFQYSSFLTALMSCFTLKVTFFIVVSNSFRSVHSISSSVK